jgi:hypothetical protein
VDEREVEHDDHQQDGDELEQPQEENSAEAHV